MSHPKIAQPATLSGNSPLPGCPAIVKWGGSCSNWKDLQFEQTESYVRTIRI